MNTMKLKKRYDDSAVDSYLDSHKVYESSDLCIDITAVIKYAREHKIAVADVSPEIIEQFTKTPAPKVG